MKKIISLFILMIAMCSISFAAESNLVTSLEWNKEDLKNAGVTQIKAYRNEVVDLSIALQDVQTDIPELNIKIEELGITIYPSLETMVEEKGKMVKKKIVQAIMIGSFENDKTYNFAVCSGDEVIKDFSVQLRIKEHEKHIYDTKTLECECGMKVKADLTIDADAEEETYKGIKVNTINAIEVSLEGYELYFERKNENVDTLSLEIVSKQANYKNTLNCKLNEYSSVENHGGFKKIYKYRFDIPTYIPDGQCSIEAKLGHEMITDIDLTIDSSYMQNANAFSDVPTTHWAHGAVMEMKAKKIINGYEDGTFRPDAPVTREEFVTLIQKCTTYTNNNDIQYEDVSKDRWSYNAIISFGMGIEDEINGKKYFNPRNYLTREEAAKLIVENAYPNATYTEFGAKQFLDNRYPGDYTQISDRYLEAVAIVTDKAKMKGTGDGMFMPQKQLTRAQAATLILNCRDNFKKVSK